MSASPALENLIRDVEGNVWDIVRAVALPKEFGDGFRIASEGSGMSSAVAKITQNINLDVWAGGPVPGAPTPYLPDDEQMCFLFNNVCRTLVYLRRAPAGSDHYHYRATVQGDQTNPPAHLHPCVPYGQTTFSMGFAELQIGTINWWDPHGPLLFPGVDQDGRTYLWVDAEGIFTATFAVAPAAVTGCVVFYIWNGKNRVQIGATQFVIAQQLYSSASFKSFYPKGAYMMCEVFNFTGVALNVDLAVHGGTLYPSWAHVSVFSAGGLGEDGLQYTTPIVACRTNAVAVKMENTSQQQQKNGSITAATIDPTVPWSYLTSGYSAVTSQASYVTQDAATGYYGFPMVDDDDDVSDFYTDVCLPATTAANLINEHSIMAFPLNERGPYKVVAAQIPILEGRNFFYEVTTVVEYQTVDKVPEQGYTRFTPQEIEAAYEILRTMDSDWPNATHYTSILGSIGKWGSRSLDAIAAKMPKVKQALSKIPAIGSVLGGAAELLTKTTIPMLRYGFQSGYERAMEQSPGYRQQEQNPVRGAYNDGKIGNFL